jgi:hypothetical protein
VVAARDARDVRYRLAASGVDRERQRLKAARDRTRQQLEEISARVSRTVGPAQASIFAAQGDDARRSAAGVARRCADSRRAHQRRLGSAARNSRTARRLRA